jgi:hypothetical protein
MRLKCLIYNGSRMIYTLSTLNFKPFTYLFIILGKRSAWKFSFAELLFHL